MRDVFAKHLAFKGVAQKDLMQPRNIGEFALEGIGLAGVVGVVLNLVLSASAGE